MKQLDYEALTAPAEQYLQMTKGVHNVLSDWEQFLAEGDAVVPTATTALSVLTGHATELEKARLALAAALHERGVSYKVVGHSLGISAMSARRWITSYNEQRSKKQQPQTETLPLDETGKGAE